MIVKTDENGFHSLITLQQAQSELLEDLLNKSLAHAIGECVCNYKNAGMEHLL